MSVFANADLFYGIIRNSENDALFDFLMVDVQEDQTFEYAHQELQEKYHVSFGKLYDGNIDYISAKFFGVCDKAFDTVEIDAEELTQYDQYKKNILDLLSEAGVEHPHQYTITWHLLTYID